MKWLPIVTGFALLATACASGSDDGSMASDASTGSESASTADSGMADSAMADSDQIDCKTAQADLRVLRSEQTHVMQQLEGGGSTMVPSSLVTEPEFSVGPVGAGQYHDYLVDRIQQIQAACGL